jgi:hypothetical protein
LKKFVLHREAELTRNERVQFHLQRLLDTDEKKSFNFVPPKKQELPLAFPPESITNGQRKKNAAQV